MTAHRFELLPSRAPAEVRHVYSVDVEEYFQVNAFEPYLRREDWPQYPTRLAESVNRLLDLLARHGTTGTFFVLGWIARQHPQVVRRIAAAGHEIASHGFWHRRLGGLSPREFREDVRDAKAALEDLAARPVTGFRAPSFSLVRSTAWAVEVLLEEGHRYDSSRFPIRFRDYGSPEVPRQPHLVHTPSGSLLELPLATLRWMGMTLPAAGGAYLRQLPYAVVGRGFAEWTRRGIPAMFYIHPWEIDEAQPRLPVPLLPTLRHYRGLERSMPRMERLLSSHRFDTAQQVFPLARPAARQGEE